LHLLYTSGSLRIHRRRYHAIVNEVEEKGAGVMTERTERGRAKGLPKPDWDSGDVSLTLLAVGTPPQWHTLRHNLGSMNLLVDAKLGGLNSQGQVVWSLSTETLFALTDPNTLTFRWALDEEVWDRYKAQLGFTGEPRRRHWVKRGY
jgi:hypothetical protein